LQDEKKYFSAADAHYEMTYFLVVCYAIMLKWSVRHRIRVFWWS